MSKVIFSYAVVMAAGRGERMKPLTDYIPKALSRTKSSFELLDLALESLPTCRRYITYGHLAEQILDSYRHFDGFINTEGASNSWFLFNSIVSFIDEPIIVTPCDIEYSIDWDILAAEIDLSIPIHIIPVESSKGIGDFIVDGKIQMRDAGASSDKICSGIQVINPKLLRKYCKEGEFYDIWDNLSKLNLLKITKTMPFRWVARDTVESLSI